MEYLYILQQALVWIITIFWIYQMAISICSLIKLKDKPFIIMDDIFVANNYDSANEETYNKILDRMIDLLNKMDENNPIYDDMDWTIKIKSMNDAKDEFFKLFSEHFYNLWD